jgi:hypothetical protein
MSFFPKTRWFQFSLRTLLIMVTLLCVGPGGYLVYQQRLAKRETDAVAWLSKDPGTQLYTRPDWLPTLLARRSAGYVVGAGLQSRETKDADLAPLAELSGLVWLHLNDTALTDQGLVHLSGLANLERLRLDETQVTDAGLQQIAKLRRLKTLNVYRTRVSDEGVKKLQAARPELDIIR